jgi:hypothetical protein
MGRNVSVFRVTIPTFVRRDSEETKSVGADIGTLDRESIGWLFNDRGYIASMIRAINECGAVGEMRIGGKTEVL